MRLPLSVYRSRIGVQWADPSVRPSCVVTPRYSRWFMDGRSAPLFRPRKGWDSKMYPLTLSRHESGRATLGLSRPWRGGRGGVCNTPLRIRQEKRLTLQLSHPRKEWDSKMYPQTLSRHESERATLGLSRPWRGGLWGVCNTPLPCWKEERTTLWLSRPWRGGRGGVCNTPLPCRKEEGSALWLSRPQKEWDSKMYPLTLSRHESGRAPLGLSRSWRGGRGADIFATCPYSFLVTITPRLTFHF